MDHLTPTLQVAFSQLSEAGIKPENQDTVGAHLSEGSSLASKGIAIAIADGVSSSNAAKQASQTAITGFLTDYYATPDTWSTEHSARQVIQSLNRYLWALSQNSARQEGHLTTFTTLILKGDTGFIFHVGDTRVYRLRDQQLEQLTRDHSQRVDAHTQYLTRALGADPALEIDFLTVELQANDLFLLTTDGIHDAIPKATFASLVKHFSDDVASMTRKLMNSAITHQSQDNLSLQCCKIVECGPISQNDAVTALSRLPFPPLLDVGQTLDGLTVKKILHESERSQVYWVTDAHNASFIMKTPSVNYEDDPVYIERFVMESWIGSRIQSANVVRVISPPNARNYLYYLTEYIPGPTLKTLIQQRAPLDIADTIELTEQIIKGLRAFHRKDTLHQDLKPDNLVMGQRGLTLIDFGSCWVAGVEELAAPFKRDLILGTLDYSAPEYRYGGSRSQRSDQFSLAVIIYEMLTGKKPFGEKFAQAMDLKAFQRLKYTAATAHNPLVPIWIDKALQKALCIHPNGRYSALSEFLLDLKRPNPKWLHPEAQPLIVRNPLRFWQVTALLGWLGALCVLFFKR